MSRSKLAITEILNNLSHKFQITVSEPKHFIGMEIERNRLDRTIKIGQSRYIQRILEKFRMKEANAVSIPAEPGLHLTQLQHSKMEGEEKQIQNVPYRKAIGSLLIVARVSRPDIEHAVNQASQCISNYGQGHWKGIKQYLDT
ncbi:hypothetical protein KM043_017074 [Ampulex compressa]|nr:hypothetical protein KM043_017074 [Ampulex compressa]